jgi:hypothetical protein
MNLRTLLFPILKIFELFDRFVLLNPFSIFIIPSELKDYEIIDTFQLSFNNKFIENKGQIMSRAEAIEIDKSSGIYHHSKELGDSKAILLTLFSVLKKRFYVQFEISDDGTNEAHSFYHTWIDLIDGNGIDVKNFNALNPPSTQKYRISFFVNPKTVELFSYDQIGFYRNLNDWTFYNVKVFIIE